MNPEDLRGNDVDVESADAEDGKATPKFRLDAAHREPPSPHMFSLPDQSDLRRLSLWLDHEDVTLSEFGEKIARYNGLSRYLMAYANWASHRKDSHIHDPTHAAAYLGITRLKTTFNQLIGEHVES